MSFDPSAVTAWPTWGMPRSALKIVAAVIALSAVAGFVLGLQGTPEKGRLPGEVATGAAGSAVDAPDATPLVDETPPPPPPEEKKKPDEEEVKKEEVDPNAVAPPVIAAPPAAPAAKAPEDKVGDLLDGVTPPPQEDPPH